MVKIINNKEYAKLKRDVDYWKTRALKEYKRKNFYENIYKSQKVKGIELIRENQLLDRKLEELEKEKVTFVSLVSCGVKNLNKDKKQDEEPYEEINGGHNCNKNCFKEHILPSIQKDYDSRSIQFKNDWQKRYCFIKHWKQNLKNEYDFLESLYMIADTIMISFK